MKCKKCSNEYNGKTKRSFLGFRKFTCPNCNTKNVGALGQKTIILYFVISVVIYILNLYDILTFTTLPDFSTLFENTLRGVYPWVILLCLPLFLHFMKEKNLIVQILIIAIILGTPLSLAIYGEYAKSNVKNLLLKANKENYALSKNIQILNSLLQNPNIGDADKIKLVAESTNETFDIMNNYRQLHRKLILPNAQFKNVSDFFKYKEDQAKVLHKVFNKITAGNTDSLEIDVMKINSLQESATSAIKSN